MPRIDLRIFYVRYNRITPGRWSLKRDCMSLSEKKSAHWFFRSLNIWMPSKHFIVSCINECLCDQKFDLISARRFQSIAEIKSMAWAYIQNRNILKYLWSFRHILFDISVFVKSRSYLFTDKKTFQVTTELFVIY